MLNSGTTKLRRKNFPGKALALLFLVGLNFLPLLYLWMQGVESPKPDILTHYYGYLFWPSIYNTFVVLIAVLIISNVLGFWAAWIHQGVSARWARLLRLWIFFPLAVPGYVLVTAYLSILSEHSDFYQFMLHNGIALIELEGLWGVIFCLSLSLFPYAFFQYSEGLQSQALRFSEVLKVYRVPWSRALWRTWIPGLFPWTLQSCWFIGLEVFADFAVFSLLNVDSLMTNLFKVWFQLFDRGLAIRLAAGLLIFIVVIFTLAERWRSLKSYSRMSLQSKRTSPSFSRNFSYVAFTLSVSFAIFFIPTFSLIFAASKHVDSVASTWLALGFRPLLSTLTLGLIGAALVVSIGSIAAIGLVNLPRSLKNILRPLLALGYMLPGAMVAVLIYPFMLLFGAPNNWIALIFVMLYRYFGVGFRVLSAALERMSRSQLQVFEVFCVGRWSQLRVYWSHLNFAMGGAFLLSFFDIIKEVPITLMFKPISTSFLSVKVFEYTQEGQYGYASVPALVLGAIGIAIVIPTFWLQTEAAKGRYGQS